MRKTCTKNASNLLRRDIGPAVEMLETRTLMSFVYENFGPLNAINDPTRFGANGFQGPVTLIDDIDADGIPDLLLGNSGQYAVGRGTAIHSGASVVSGATGTTLRTYEAPFSVALGWGVANVGDLDDDGIGEYAISTYEYRTGLPFVVSTNLYDGATGDLLRIYDSATLAAAGDVDADGHADLLISYVEEARAEVAAGATGAVLREFLATGVPDITAFGRVAHGGFDLNGDSVPDSIIESREDVDFSGFTSRYWAFSGADGSILWHNTSEDGFVPVAYTNPFVIGADLSGDGVPDLVATAEDHIFIRSGADGSALHDFRGPTNTRFADVDASYGDFNEDSVPDIVVGFLGESDDGNILVVSGANGETLATLGFAQRPSDVYPFLSFGNGIIVYDQDGDSLNDIFALYKYPGSYGVPPGSASYIFNGSMIAEPVIGGISSGPVSRSLVWGSIQGRQFIVRDTVRDFITGLKGFSEGDVIIDVFEVSNQIIILGAASASGESPFLWTSGLNLDNPVRTDFNNLDVVNAPDGEITGFRALGVSGPMVLIERILNGDTPTTWLADMTHGSLTFLFEGTPNDLGFRNENAFTRGAVVALGVNGAEQSVARIWNNGVVTELLATSAAISPTGRFVVITSPGESGLPDSMTLINLVDPDTLPLIVLTIAGGTDFAPVGVNDAGDITGTYLVTDGERQAAFYYVNSLRSMLDLQAGEVFADPTDYATLALNTVSAPTNFGDVLVSQRNRYSLLTVASAINPDGPYAGVAAGIAVAFTPAGDVYVISGNEAGEVFSILRTPHLFERIDLATGSIFSAAAVGQIVTWYNQDDANPHIVIARADGLFLLVPGASAEDGWTLRNLTEEIPGAEAIIDGLVSMLPPSGLRLVAGLNADGELVLYGQTEQTNPDGGQAWAYDNLYDSVVYPTNTPPPAFRQYTGVANLVAYVTSWGGLNIAGIAGGGQIVVFWTAPGLEGWQITNLAQVSEGTNTAESNYRSLHVALTPWDGINLYGESLRGNRIQVSWWVPQFGGTWRVENVVPENEAAGVYPANTLTAYATPWGGLNLARVDPLGHVEVYWWSPASNEWARESLNTEAGSYLSRFRAVGRLQSAVSAQGEMDVFARNELGDLFRFNWSLARPQWLLERM